MESLLTFDNTREIAELKARVARLEASLVVSEKLIERLRFYLSERDGVDPYAKEEAPGE